MKKFIATILSVCTSSVFADAQQTTEATTQANILQESQTISQSQQPVAASPDYIAKEAYIQNPYIGMPSGGGTNTVSESQIKEQNIAEKWFNDGTWNAFAAASYVNLNGANNYGYGANIFGQTGQVAGFSFGGLMTIMNPFFSNQWNPAEQSNQAQTLPIAQQITPQELFAEYQYKNIFQADAGFIGINNSPWMTYYQNNALNMITYQGAILNLNPGGGWLLTGFAINGTQLLGETGFSQQTMYNQAFDYGTGTANVASAGSPSTIALGANWTDSDNNLNLRVWGYQFEDYANLLYADTAIKLPVNDDLGFILNFQGALQGSNSSGNVLNSSGYGNSVNSNMVGAQLGFNYKILGLQLGYNNIWGPENGYEGGGLISPYTYQIATDPLYTTGWMLGMVEKSAGQAYKVAPSLNLLDSQLVITPSYQYYATTAVPASSEYDLQVSYAIPDVKGLTLFAGYGYVVQPVDGGGDTNAYQGQFMVSYLY